jgi:hypothetical protein
VNRTVTVLALLVAAMAVFIVREARRVPPPATAPASAADTVPVDTAGDASLGTPATGLVSVRTSTLPAPIRDLADIQRILAAGEAGTYIREIFLQRDDNNARWPDRRFDPLRVWIQPTSDLPDFDPSYPELARQAFERWTREDVPMAFTFVRDSAASDIPLTWVDRFDMPISGRTRWTHDQHWWIVASSIEIALHHQSGTPLNARAIHAITLHEVGHVLGLDHTQDDRSIMAARVRVSDLADVDARTVRLVYRLPPGRAGGEREPRENR